MRALAAGMISFVIVGIIPQPAGGSSPSVPSTTTPTTSSVGPATTVAAPDQAGQPIDVGLAPLDLLEPATSGAGDHPTFRWAAVNGASTYLLAILTAEHVPVWAWQGAVTEVVLGGWDQAPPPEAPGPRLSGPSQWFVVALDASGLPLANSALRPVTP